MYRPHGADLPQAGLKASPASVNLEQMKERMTAARFANSPFLDDLHALTVPGGQTVEVERIPNGRVTLIFRVLQGESKADLWAAGPHMRIISKSKAGVSRTVILRIKPGWSVAALGVATNELTNRIVPLQDLWGPLALDLLDSLVAAPSPTRAMQQLSEATSLRVGRAKQTTSARLTHRAVALLEEGSLRVESIARRLEITDRHLRRAFTENVGMGPKEFARVVRLHRAVRMAGTSGDWARIAVDAGYYDQAHLIGDFQRFVGSTPGAFLARKLRRDPEKLAWTG